jgi:methionine aminotransferase
MPLYPDNIKSKLPGIGVNIFSKMSALSQKHGAINLSQGFPDFGISPHLVDLVNHYMSNGFNQYAPMEGVLKLREAISTKVEALYSAKYEAETEITITAGGTQAIYSAITAFINEGDEVIIFTPAYDCYAPAVELNGGKPIYVQLKEPYYNVDWSEVKKVMTRRTKMIVINTPHNPTGAVLSSQDMVELERLTNGTDIIVLSDEVYEHILFDGYEHQSVARFPKLAERSLLIYSFGKTLHATGWKMGYVLGAKNLMKEFRKIHQFQVFAVNHPIQHALADFLSNEENYKHISSVYEQKRNFFLNALKGSRFKFSPTPGSYFQLLDYSTITDENDVKFAERLTKEFKVSAIPISVFYHRPLDNKVLRFCFAKQEETLAAAAEILKNI